MATQSSLLLSNRIISQPTITLSSSLIRRQSVDESIIREQVLSTHNDDAAHDFNTNFILTIAENILRLHMGTAEETVVKKLNKVEELNNHEQLPYHIRQVSLEIASGLNVNVTNQHSTTMDVLSMLCWYSWEDKLVLMLAAFSIIYGEFSLRKCNLRLAGKLASLKQSRLSSDEQKSVMDCISSVLELIKCVFELKQWTSYSPPQSSILALPIATYWIATSLVKLTATCACGSHFKVHQNEVEELTALIAKILATFSPELAKKKAEESFETLRNALYHNSSNRVEVFKLMFNVKDDYEGIFRYNRGLNHWRGGRTVLLLITSGFDISAERIGFLYWFQKFYLDSYIIWIPITQNNESWTTEDEQQFEKLKEKMHVYSSWLLGDPRKRLLPQFTRFVKEELLPEFHMGWVEEPILVSIDLRGRIVHPNVMHMILTWNPGYIQENTVGVQRLYNITPLIANEVKEGTSGVNRVVPEIDQMISDFLSDVGDKINGWTHLVENKIQKAMDQSTPYNSEREKDLWQQERTWSLHLLAPKFPGRYRAIGELINNWIHEGKYIFLYGGNDIKWVQEFTSKARAVASKTQSKLELVYIGKNKKVRGIIDKERMSHCPLHNSTSLWWFWTRLRSMFLLRIRYLDVTNHPVEEYNNDEILQGLKKLLAYENKNSRIEGWALLSKGSKVIACGHGTKMLQAMNGYQIWKENGVPQSFDQVFKDHQRLSVNKHSCCTLEYPIMLSQIPENERCPECSRRMHKFLSFTCCHGHNIDSIE